MVCNSYLSLLSLLQPPKSDARGCRWIYLCRRNRESVSIRNAHHRYRRTIQSVGYRSPRLWSTCQREAQPSNSELLEPSRSFLEMLPDLDRQFCVLHLLSRPRGFDLSEGWTRIPLSEFLGGSKLKALQSGHRLRWMLDSDC